MKVNKVQSLISKLSFFALILAMPLLEAAPALAQTTPNFGPNVYVVDPSMSSSTIQSTLNSFSNEDEFSTNRHAVLFKPGTYNINAAVGYYESLAGLGQTPDAVVINGSIRGRDREAS